MNSIIVIAPREWCMHHLQELETHPSTSMQYSPKSNYVSDAISRLNMMTLPFELLVYVPKKFRHLTGSGTIEYVCRVIDIQLSETRIDSPWQPSELPAEYRKHHDHKYELWFKVDRIERCSIAYDNLTCYRKDGTSVQYENGHSLVGAARGRIVFASTNLPFNYPYHKEQDLQERVQASLAMGSEARRSRLVNAQRHPRSVTVTTTVFDRNPDVIAEALSIANGICGGCGCNAPFIRRSDGSPYLEVHHRISLATGGEDSIENAEALCPNCHRRKHFGQ